jgi:hypothetical protein
MKTHGVRCPFHAFQVSALFRDFLTAGGLFPLAAFRASRLGLRAGGAAPCSLFFTFGTGTVSRLPPRPPPPPNPPRTFPSCNPPRGENSRFVFFSPFPSPWPAFSNRLVPRFACALPFFYPPLGLLIVSFTGNFIAARGR